MICLNFIGILKKCATILFLPLNVQCSSWSVDHLFTFGQFAQRSAIIGFTRVGFYNCYDHSISVDILAEYIELNLSIKRDNCVMFPSYCEHTGAGGDLLLTSSNVNIVQQFCVLCRTDPTRGLRALLVTSSAACCQLPSGRLAVTIYVTPATHTSQYM